MLYPRLVVDLSFINTELKIFVAQCLALQHQILKTKLFISTSQHLIFSRYNNKWKPCLQSCCPKTQHCPIKIYASGSRLQYSYFSPYFATIYKDQQTD